VSEVRELAEASRAEPARAQVARAEVARAEVARAEVARAERAESVRARGDAETVVRRDELAAAYAQGYAEGRAQAAGDVRRRLLGLIVSDRPPADLVASLARSLGWPLPAQVAVATLAGRTAPDNSDNSGNNGNNGNNASGGGAVGQRGRPPLGPDVLADWSGTEPCLLVPDPDGPGRPALLDRALRGWLAAIGPTVPLAGAAVSLRWARRALALARGGVIAAGGAPVRCDQHLSTLLILADEDLAQALRRARLAPLARLRPAQRDRIADTLLAWLQLGENAAEVAHQMHVHPQTVRYRLRQIQQLFGDQLRDPDRRFELLVALRARHLLSDR